MVLLCRNNATINAHVKTQNRVKHRVWHTDPWPDPTEIVDLVTHDPENWLHLWRVHIDISEYCWCAECCQFSAFLLHNQLIFVFVGLLLCYLWYRLKVSFPSQTGYTGIRKLNHWLLGKQEMMGWQWHQLYLGQIIFISLQMDNHASTSSLNIYRPDALADDQSTVSKHRISATYATLCYICENVIEVDAM